MRPLKTIQCTLCQSEILTRAHNRLYCDICRRQRIREQEKATYRKYAEYYKAKAKTYQETNREEVLKKKREQYHSQIELKRQKDNDRYHRDKERRLDLSHRRYASNKDRILAQTAAKHAANPEPMRQRVIRWSQNNPDKVRNMSRVKRVRRRNAQGSHTMNQFWEVCKTYQWKCAYCLCALDKSTVTEDHLTPLSRGGSDWIDNIVPACLSCNCSKHTKTYEEYKNSAFYRLKIRNQLLRGD